MPARRFKMRDHNLANGIRIQWLTGVGTAQVDLSLVVTWHVASGAARARQSLVDFKVRWRWISTPGALAAESLQSTASSPASYSRSVGVLACACRDPGAMPQM